MSDQPDPWALVLRHRSQRGGFIVTSSDVRAAFAEVERRHAEALKVKDTEHQRHFEIMQQTQNLASSIMDTLRAQLQHVTAERNAADARLAEVEVERDKAEAEVESLRAQLDQQAQRYNAALDRLIADKDQLSLAGSHLRAQLAAVQETAQAVLREWDDYKTTGQLRAGGAMYDLRVALEPLTLKEPKA